MRETLSSISRVSPGRQNLEHLALSEDVKNIFLGSTLAFYGGVGRGEQVEHPELPDGFQHQGCGETGLSLKCPLKKIRRREFYISSLPSRSRFPRSL